MSDSEPSFALAMLLALAPCTASAQALVNERSISANAALEMATAALDACRHHGSVVTITYSIAPTVWCSWYAMTVRARTAASTACARRTPH